MTDLTEMEKRGCHGQRLHEDTFDSMFTLAIKQVIGDVQGFVVY